jgi:hypothetical protein
VVRAGTGDLCKKSLLEIEGGVSWTAKFKSRSVWEKWLFACTKRNMQPGPIAQLQHIVVQNSISDHKSPDHKSPESPGPIPLVWACNPPCG